MAKIRLIAILLPISFAFACEITNETYFMTATVMTPPKDSLNYPYNLMRWLNNLGGNNPYHFQHSVVNDSVCHRLRIEHFELRGVDLDRSMILIQNETLKQAMNNSDIIVGPYSTSMINYAASMDKFYFVNEPILMQKELEGLPQKVIALWSSKSVFLDAVSRNIDLLLETKPLARKQKILLLEYEKCETEDSTLMREFLLKQLRNDNRLVETFQIKETIDEVAYMLFVQCKEKGVGVCFRWEWVRRDVFDLMTPLHRKVQAADITLLFFACQDPLKKLNIMRTIFNEASGFDVIRASWMLVDPEILYLEYPGMYHATVFDILNIVRVQDFFYFYKVSTFPMQEFQDAYMECMDAQSGLPIAGVLEFRKLFNLVMSHVPNDNITLTAFLDNLKKFVHFGPTDRARLRFRGFPYSIEVKLMGDQKLIIGNALRIRNQCGTLRSYYSTLENVDFFRDFVSGKVGDRSHDAFILETPDGQLSDDGVWDVPTFSSPSNDYVVAGLPKTKDPLPVILVIPEMPYVRIRQDKKYEGFAIDILNAVTVELYKRGILLEFEYQERQVYGLKENGTWTGVFKELTDPESRAVMAIGLIAKTPDRVADVEFTQTLGSSYLTYVARKRKRDQMFQFLFPFDSNTWISLLSVMLFVALTFTLLQKWNPFEEEIPEDHKLTIAGGIWQSFTLMSMFGAPFGMITVPNRILSSFVWFFALVVLATYCGNLVSFLTQKEAYIDELEPEGLVGKYDFGSLPLTSVQEYHRNRYSDQNRVLGHNDVIVNEIRQKFLNSSHGIDTYSAGIEKVIKNDFIFFGLSMPLFYLELNTPDCSVKMLQKKMENRVYQEFGFPMRPDWEYAQTFKEVLFTLEEDGLLPELHSKWMDFSGICKPVTDSNLPQLGWETSYGILAILGIGVVSAFLCLFVKLVYLKCRGHKVQKESDMVSKRSEHLEGEDNFAVEVTKL